MSGPVPVRSEEMVISFCLELLDVLWLKRVGNDRGRKFVPIGMMEWGKARFTLFRELAGRTSYT